MKKAIFISLGLFGLLNAESVTLDAIDTNASVDFFGKVYEDKSSNEVKDKELTKYNINSTANLGAYFSNLKIYAQSADHFPAISFRGVSNVDYYSSVIGVYVDDVPQSPNFLIQNLPDVESVLLVNGAEGLLYGENAPLGLIYVRTKSPLRGNYAKASISASRLQEDINGQIGWNLIENKLWGKMNFRYIHDNGFIKDPETKRMLNGGDSFNIGTTLYYQASDALLFTGHYSFYRTHTHKDFLLTKKQMDNLAVSNSQQATWEEFTKGEQDKILNKAPFFDLLAHNASIKAEYGFRDSTLFVIGALQRNDTLGNNYPGISVQNTKTDGYYYNNTQAIGEVKLHTQHSSVFESLFGVYYKYLLTDNGMRNMYDAQNAFQYRATWDTKEDVNTFALYGNTSYTWGAWTLHTGLRYQFFYTRVFSDVPPVVGWGSYTDAKIFQALNPRIALHYKLGDVGKAFLELSSATKPGGFSKFPFADADVKPYDSEQDYSAELGTKLNFLESRLSLKTSLYGILRTNTQAYVGAGYFQTIKTIGNAYAVGLDADLRYSHEWFATFINANLGISKFAKGGKNVGSVVINGTAGNYDLSGLITKFSPVLSLNAGFDFSLLNRENHKLTFSTLLNFTTSYYIDDFTRDDADMLQKPRILLDFSFNYNLFKHYDIALFFQNVTNTRFAATAIIGLENNGTGPGIGKAFMINNPFNAGVRLTYSY